ncbi:macrophage mannose receptor 1-like isoform X2 [Colossoma macropomum]|uniref:macrophage mannose receptor 1-like isoform X2 n=1 Tax=Colossoma macropomum TaxID=42526 RepID=UPI00186516A2|nr:macrophage mannose receptor 1-like isoform X2 [Colossoma macropomum]
MVSRKMGQAVFLMLLVSDLLVISAPLSCQYHYMNESKTWFEAQSYCRERYTDLATVDSMEEMKKLIVKVDPGYRSTVWIGLKRGNQTTWGWSMGNNTFSKYTNWASGQPNGDGWCGLINSGSWWDRSCDLNYTFICYNESSIPSQRYIHVQKQLTWRAAQRYCREIYTDLSSIRNAEENNQLNYTLDDTWVGLFSDSWAWSDQSTSSFRYWADSEPGQTDKCVSVAVNDSARWYDEDCSLKRNFVCQNYVKIQILRVKVSSNGKKDLSEPEINAAILKQIEEKLKEKGINGIIKVSWKEMDGRVFCPEKKMKK